MNAIRSDEYVNIVSNLFVESVVDNERLRKILETERKELSDISLESTKLKQKYNLLEERCSTLEKDLDEALKRADLSDVGEGTPNPFDSKLPHVNFSI